MNNMAVIQVNRELQGKILDIGGGGEGIIGRIYGAQVVAIDNRQEELDEAPDGFEKILMDASRLSFPEEYFEHVTAFYSFLFIPKELFETVISQVARVLCNGGQFHIWDCSVETAYPKPFIIELDINANGTEIHTTYGIGKENAAQNATTFIRLCQCHGFRLQKLHSWDGSFYLCFEK